MRRIIPIALAIVAAGLAVALPASAEEESEFGRAGPYIGANVTGASYTRLDEVDNDLSADPAVGFNAYAGYRLAPSMAFEAQYEMLIGTQLDLDGVTSDAGSLDATTITGNFKFFFLSGRIQPFALLGFGALLLDLDDDTGQSASGTESNFAMRYGLGLDVYITKQIAASIGASYVLPAGSNIEDFDYVSYGAGIQYRF
jgi:opacity protein-like surface antigen